MPLYLKYAVSFIYFLLLLYTIIRILLHTHSIAKALAYILLIIVVPLAGMIFYYAFGLNLRLVSINSRIAAASLQFSEAFHNHVPDHTHKILHAETLSMGHYSKLVKFIYKLSGEHLSWNDCNLLTNGEEKFPEIIRTLEGAKLFIHIEYYNWENDTRGNQIKDVLLKKAAAGVKIRVIFDDYASRKIKTNIIRELKRGGIETSPAIKLGLVRFAVRMNHRDHRKIIIVDGQAGFVGGINISDRYDNSIDTDLFWRDTHVKITGPAVLNLQYHFVISWNACQTRQLVFQDTLLPKQHQESNHKELVQIVAGGPIYPMSNIMLTYFTIFTLAKERLYITNPYFIPSDSILDALKQASISGADVRIILPGKSDSIVVGLASQFYFSELLQAGVKIYLYQKGFVHAKTVVADGFASVVGTANMDIRSFDLNFEIMSVIYGTSFGRQLEDAFLKDLEECIQVDMEEWSKMRKSKHLAISTARLISEFL